MAQEVTVKTGPVRTSGYAIKLRKTINAALRGTYKQGRLNAKKVNETITKLNQMLYEVIVEGYEIPKDTILNIQATILEHGDDIVIKEVAVEIWNRDEILSKAVTKEITERLKKTSKEA
uniref:DUF2258 domain-containing protein n=1 Tax=Fervidicoccus fontis TaxID=683846 RepID=A0A7J3ZMB9_9CREN